MLERGPRYKHTDFRQSMDIDHLSNVYSLIQGQGAQIVVANGVGGGSNLYLAASLRSPRETFERRDHRPDDGPDRRMWPAAISRDTLDPYYAPGRGGAARAAPDLEPGLEVGRPVGGDARRTPGTPATACRSRSTSNRCVQAKWCHTGCIFGAKNSVITNYLPSAEQLGVQVRPNSAGGAGPPEPGPPVPLRRERRRARQRGTEPDQAADRATRPRSSARS